jgi:hypothetical protein
VRADVDDPPVPVPPHLRYGRGAAAPGTQQIGVDGGEDPLEIRGVCRAVPVDRHRRVVDQDVEPAVVEAGVG